MSVPSNAIGTQDKEFARALGLFDSIAVVAGTMVGSGVFIVPAEMTRLLGSGGWLLVAWCFAGVLTICAGLSYGELASMMPRAGGMYVYLRQAYSPMLGFLYGWTLFTVIQTGTIAAVAVAFSRYASVLFPSISENAYLISPLHILPGYALSLSTGQLIAIAVIALLTWTNSLGIEYGKIVQNFFTVTKIAGLALLIIAGISFGVRSGSEAGLSHLWSQSKVESLGFGLDATSIVGLCVAICLSQSGALFSADAWHDITFAAGEVKEPEKTLPRALNIGIIMVIGLFLLTNISYLSTLTPSAIQSAPGDRVAAASLNVVLPGLGTAVMAVAIMISTFGCVNSLILAGPRVYYTMAREGLFLRSVGVLNKAAVPGRSLLVQGIWASALVLARTYQPATNTYGNLYSNLLDYVISSALIFYALTIIGVGVLRRKFPDVPRPYRTPGYPVVPAIYVIGASIVLITLFVFRPASTWPGVLIVVLGVPVYYWLRRNIPVTSRS